MGGHLETRRGGRRGQLGRGLLDPLEGLGDAELALPRANRADVGAGDPAARSPPRPRVVRPARTLGDEEHERIMISARARCLGTSSQNASIRATAPVAVGAVMPAACAKPAFPVGHARLPPPRIDHRYAAGWSPPRRRPRVEVDDNSPAGVGDLTAIRMRPARPRLPPGAEPRHIGHNGHTGRAQFRWRTGERSTMEWTQAKAVVAASSVVMAAGLAAGLVVIAGKIHLPPARPSAAARRLSPFTGEPVKSLGRCWR